MLRRHAMAIVVGALVGHLGCGTPPGARGRDDGRLRVAVSLPPQAWIVERLAGDRVRVDVILPPAVSPETWAATPAAMLAVGQADLYFAVGHPAMAFENRLVARAAASGAVMVDFGRTAGEDPHPWLDPVAVEAVSAVLARHLGELDPDGAAQLADNLERLVAEIDALERRLDKMLENRRRDLVMVQHSAWSRLLGRYGIEEAAIESEGKEPDPSTLIALVELARRQGVPVIFTQRGTSQRSAQLISAEVGARVEVLDPLARDWSGELERSISAFAAALR